PSAQAPERTRPSPSPSVFRLRARTALELSLAWPRTERAVTPPSALRCAPRARKRPPAASAAVGTATASAATAARAPRAFTPAPSPAFVASIPSSMIESPLMRRKERAISAHVPTRARRISRGLRPPSELALVHPAAGLLRPDVPDVADLLPPRVGLKQSE